MRFFPRSALFLVPAIVLPLAALGSAAWLGYKMSPGQADVEQVYEATAVWDEQVAQQRSEIAALKQSMDDSAHALARRLGRLQAQVTRLNAAGERMAQIAKLDAAEFDFNREPPVGGPESAQEGPAPGMDELNAAIREFSADLDARERQMRVLRELLVAGELREEVMPSGRPVTKGWISSTYGLRRDPFTGRSTSHHGVDFAAGLGADVVSVASGVVSYAGVKGGYGNQVEINHGNGYVTRYGHNQKILVNVGDRVDRGQVIAKMGATGRATGPHVHFEVMRNGKLVNPTEYIHAAR